MLTKLKIRNFKRFEDVEIDLGQTVVFIGPNNAGKTTALQALALWELGLRRYVSRHPESIPQRRPGVTLNRREISSLPIADTSLLWKKRQFNRYPRADSKPRTETVPIGIEVEGEGGKGRAWRCGLELVRSNEESIRCRLAETSEEDGRVPDEASSVRVALLPPMSGLISNEVRVDEGAVQVRIGEGRTAEVLRNLCYQAFVRRPEAWTAMVERIRGLFGVTLSEPRYVLERGEIEISYEDAEGTTLDLASSGRGLQQTLLLLAYMHNNPGAVLLLDEPDAHLEILRQREIYEVVTELALEHGSQIVAASHSEVWLNEAADRDVVIAFVGRPHRIDDRGSQLRKSLTSIGFEGFYQAEQRGWVLYLEGSTDLAILRALARVLDHPAKEALERPFVVYVGNKASKAKEHFFGVREAKEDLVGLALFDRDDVAPSLGDEGDLRVLRWRRREIECYFAAPEVLADYAESLAQSSSMPLFEASERQRLVREMHETVGSLVPPIALGDPEDPYWRVTKVSDDLLPRVFAEFFRRLQIPDPMPKSNYHVLARHARAGRLDPEVREKLDAIVEVASRARPAGASPT